MTKAKPFLYSQEQLDFLSANRTMETDLLVQSFNERFGLDKTSQMIRSLMKRKRWHSGRTGRFAKGNVPWTKGTKGQVPPNSGQFKKGDRPKNTDPVGSEKVATIGYLKVKVAEPNVWRFKHKLIWEQTHGAVPKGHVVRFIDGDRMNCVLENLELLDRRTHRYLNRWTDYSTLDPAVKEPAKAIAKIKLKVVDIKKKNGVV